jgi:hypothetical protein
VPVLAALGLLLLLLSAAPTGSSHLTGNRGDTVSAAVGHAAIVARTAPERVLGAHRLSVHGQSTYAALPGAVLLTFLLALRTRRDRGVGAARPALLRAAAGRGPPVTS